MYITICKYKINLKSGWREKVMCKKSRRLHLKKYLSDWKWVIIKKEIDVIILY